MSWTLTTSGACMAKAGVNASFFDNTMSGAYLVEYVDKAESFLCTATRKDWITDYSKVKTNFKQMISDIVSDLVAIKILNFDMSGFTSREEAQTMLDILTDNSKKGIEMLKEDNIKEVMLE